MTGILSSLEQEFASRAQTERDQDIAVLRKLDAEGRGRVEVWPAAQLLGVLTVLFGAAMLYVAFGTGRSSGGEQLGFAAGGVASCAFAVWALLLNARESAFTLTEQGVDVRGVLLPWSSIEDFGVMTNVIYGVSVMTTVSLQHVEGYEPPKLPVSRGKGQSLKDRKTGIYASHLSLFVKPRGMSTDALAGHIGRLHAGALAREELRRLEG